MHLKHGFRGPGNKRCLSVVPFMMQEVSIPKKIKIICRYAIRRLVNSAICLISSGSPR